MCCLVGIFGTERVTDGFGATAKVAEAVVDLTGVGLMMVFVAGLMGTTGGLGVGVLLGARKKSIERLFGISDLFCDFDDFEEF